MKMETIVDKMYESVKDGLEYIQSEPVAASLLSKALANEKKIVFDKDVDANTTDDKSDSFVPITEETANALAKAFKEARNSIKKFGEEIGKTTDIILKKVKSDIEKDVEHYTQKAETSCFIIRWWYKRKLQKAEDNLEAINDIIKEYYANRGGDKSPA